MTDDFSGATWRKSSRSDTTPNQCVEVARSGGTVAVRDSKAPDEPYLTMPAAAWARLIGHIQNQP
ncbi:DUF397 domain-containing protein [Actinomadura sp. 9N407]|uniref:DUF397 domain-containing protein n=1 Tax=Actinomadura sp. 9N407 TaxID=3375154 RepID=UPI0037A2994C